MAYTTGFTVNPYRLWVEFKEGSVMPIRAEVRETLTPRERAELDWEKESAIMQKEYGEKLALMELEVKKLEVKWSQLFRLPEYIILLPVRLIMAFAIPISAFTKRELPKSFWEFMK